MVARRSSGRASALAAGMLIALALVLAGCDSGDPEDAPGAATEETLRDTEEAVTTNKQAIESAAEGAQEAEEARPD